MISVHGVLLLPVALYWLATGVTTVAALWMAHGMFRQLRLARWVEDTPTSKIRSAAQGLVELSGQLATGGRPLLRAPLTGNSCLWYRFKVEEYRGGGQAGRRNGWRQIEQGESEQSLLLKDDTGQCWIHPEGAEIHPLMHRRWEGRHRWPLEPARRGALLGALIGRRYRYTEEWLHEDDLLYALGWFESGGGGRQGGDQNRLVGDIIRTWKTDYPDLLARFDRNGDRRLDQPEWERVRAAAAQEAQRRQRDAGQAPVEHVLGKPPHKGLPFMVSAHPEEQLSHRLRRRSGWRLLGLLVTGCLAGWFWLALI